MSKIITPVGLLPLGTRVKLTPKGLRHFYSSMGYDKNLRGTVIGYGRVENEIRVLRDKYITPNTYHSDFWEKANDNKSLETD